jgi:hypothetical protein
MSFKDQNVANLLLKAAQACHLLTALYESIGGFGHLKIRKNFVNVVASWFLELKGHKDKAPDNLVQAYILLNSSQNVSPIKDMEQLFRGISDAALWASQITDKMPSASSWFTFWLQENGKFLSYNLNNCKSFDPFFKAMAAYLFTVHPRDVLVDDSLCRKMVINWARQPWRNVKSGFSFLIWKRLQIINNKDNSLMFLAALRNYSPGHRLIKEIENELGIKPDEDLQKYFVNIELTHEERIENVNNGLTMRCVDFSRKMTLVGAGTLTLQPVATYINKIAGRNLPIITYLEQNAFEIGIKVVGVGMSSLGLLAVAMVVGTLFMSILKQKK